MGGWYQVLEWLAKQEREVSMEEIAKGTRNSIHSVRRAISRLERMKSTPMVVVKRDANNVMTGRIKVRIDEETRREMREKK